MMVFLGKMKGKEPRSGEINSTESTMQNNSIRGGALKGRNILFQIKSLFWQRLTKGGRYFSKNAVVPPIQIAFFLLKSTFTISAFVMRTR